MPVPPHREGQQQQDEQQEARQSRRESRLDTSSFGSSSSEASATATYSSTTLQSRTSPPSATSSCGGREAKRHERRRSSQRDAGLIRVPLTYRPMGWSGLFTMRMSPSLPFSLEPELGGPLLQLPLDMCNTLRQEMGQQGTVLLCPHLAAWKLIMMYHGAAGQTRRQLGRLLGFPEVDADPPGQDVAADTATYCGANRPQSAIVEMFGLHACLLFSSDFHRPRTKLGAAGAMTNYLTLFHDASVRLAARYHNPLAMFSPQIHAMDFATCADECRLYIDGLFRALSDFTFERPLFSSSCVGPDAQLVFASMVLFDSKLPAQFQPSRGWCDDIAATVLEVPYNSPQLESMVVFLPDSPFGGLASLERSLSKDKIMDCLARLEQRGPVDVTLPRLRLRCATDFARLLPAMGARDAFGEAADFSNMVAVDEGSRSLKVSAVKHFAVFRIGLRSAGTRTAAQATTLPPIVDRADGRNLEFTVDRPFLFLVLGKDPSSVFFLGSVTKPSA
ncbi:hypothetical protein HPB49_024517 [Dermacentor silvarum]|uniref:Uncharacterized protein n=1 Tax=Dermacentor silvarum TaxID=543639 RepID=A0ACB8CII3_DERSI|nr:hypothetical protein HPB49_024517 [Dermacentor silvarum]